MVEVERGDVFRGVVEGEMELGDGDGMKLWVGEEWST